MFRPSVATAPLDTIAAGAAGKCVRTLSGQGEPTGTQCGLSGTGGAGLWPGSPEGTVGAGHVSCLSCFPEEMVEVVFTAAIMGRPGAIRACVLSPWDGPA